MFDTHLLSKYRSCLMGASAILIILCHAPASVEFPSWISSVLVRGGWGVDIFLYLSGLGLFFSLKHNICQEGFTLQSWYSKRFKKLMIPYLLSYAPLCIIRALLKHESILAILGDISTISFWTRHSGPWFVALIILLYLLAPLLYSAFNKFRAERYKFIFLIFLVSLCMVLSVLNLNTVRYDSVLYNAQFALARVPAFLLGMYSGAYVLKNYVIRFPLIWCTIFILLSICLNEFVPRLYVSGLMALPVMFLLCLLFSKGYQVINRLCDFMGQISLESYLFNGLLPFFFINKTCVIGGVNVFYANYIPYLLVVIAGTILSLLVHKISLKLIHYTTNK